MLVLTRKIGEKIQIGSAIFVTVVDIVRGRVRIGVEAPRDVPVHRAEIVEKMSLLDSGPAKKGT